MCFERRKSFGTKRTRKAGWVSDEAFYAAAKRQQAMKAERIADQESVAAANWKGRGKADERHGAFFRARISG